MSNPKLTIAIPTYNRAEKLDAQLAWAVNSIRDIWDECELIISDNASTDDTPNICSRWQQQTANRLRVIRQPENIGLVRNVLFCIERAQGAFVWIVSDDDIIGDNTFSWVMECVRSASAQELGYILLNFGTKNGYDGELLQERFYQFFQDRKAVPGVSLFEECTTIDEGGVMAISANIYNTNIANSAIKSWGAIAGNLAFPIFLSGYAAAHGGMLIRAEPALIYPHHTGSHLGTWLNTVFHDIPAAYWALRQEGYSPGFIRRRILTRASFLVFAARFPVQFVKALYIYFRAARMKNR